MKMALVNFNGSSISCFMVLICAAFLVGICDSRCPPPEDMKPCVCVTNCSDCPAEMKCSDMHNPSDIHQVLEKTKNYPFKDLVIDHSALLYIPADGIEERGFRRFKLKDSNLGRLFDRAPSSNLLNEVWFQKTLIRSGFQWKLLSNLTELRSLVIVDTEIRRLSSKFGDVPPTLKSVWLVNTKTMVIDSGAFEKLVNLETLYITKSNVRVLDRGILPKPSNIKAFMILNSRIQSIPEDMFSEMPDLKSIVLSGNRITKFQNSVFGSILPQLSMFSLDNNPLRCDCDTKWVTAINRFPHFFSGKCNEPKELQGKNLRDLKRRDFRQC